MDDRESQGIERCVVCGEEVDLTDGSNLTLSASVAVCHQCARQHGGVYESASEEWKIRPRIPRRYLKAARHDR